ncbi:hypothetical protein VV01_00390 [Luteipulveratus halotolerans]|uniref:butyrate kinase n=1 Tax=Luteipulveratus halotolerans TaxID=1631356 RepID=A0A0L6CDU3_9MICO|nr:hypothetical protein VV01_00390 [Luteipulveratus halotolerans]
MSAVLVLNAGSSSLKFQVVDPETGEAHAKGIVERVGSKGSTISVTVDGEESETSASAPDHGAGDGADADDAGRPRRRPRVVRAGRRRSPGRARRTLAHRADRRR